jgi:hypothetical protein
MIRIVRVSAIPQVGSRHAAAAYSDQPGSARMSNEDAVAVTDENFGDLLIEGLQEAVAVARGEREPAGRKARPIPAGRDGSRA